MRVWFAIVSTDNTPVEILPGPLSLTLSLTFSALMALPAAGRQATAGADLRTATKAAVRASALATIRVNALSSINQPLGNSLVRLRDAKIGRIVSSSLTDKMGAYSFKGLDPGNYVVEIVGTDQTPLAATNLINVNAGDSVSAVVKLPFKPTMIGSLLGNRLSPATSDGPAAGSLGQIVSQALDQLPQAAAQAIPAVVPVGAPMDER
jgi:hypothetical protein